MKFPETATRQTTLQSHCLLCVNTQQDIQSGSLEKEMFGVLEEQAIGFILRGSINTYKLYNTCFGWTRLYLCCDVV